MSLAPQRHVLAVYPHPDDESLGKAGTLALFSKQKTPMTLICSTLGQMGRNMGRPLFANRETLPKIREKELRDACEVLCIEDLRLFRLRDKTLEFEDPEYLADKIETVIHEVNPSLIITYYPKFGVHPDHDAMSHATVIAVKRLPLAKRPVIYGSPVTRDAREILGPPDIEIDVREVYDVKMAAIRAHKSQTEGMLLQMAEEAQKDEAVKAQMEANMNTESYWIVPIGD